MGLNKGFKLTGDDFTNAVDRRVVRGEVYHRPADFRAKDVPQYIPAKTTILVTQASEAVVSVVLFAYYVWLQRSKYNTMTERCVWLSV